MYTTARSGLAAGGRGTSGRVNWHCDALEELQGPLTNLLRLGAGWTSKLRVVHSSTVTETSNGLHHGQHLNHGPAADVCLLPLHVSSPDLAAYPALCSSRRCFIMQSRWCRAA